MVQSLTLSLNPQLILKPILLTHKKPFKRVPEASEKDCQKTFLVSHPTTISPRKVIPPTHMSSRDGINSIKWNKWKFFDSFLIARNNN